jgi:hypothetical protein
MSVQRYIKFLFCTTFGVRKFEKSKNCLHTILQLLINTMQILSMKDRTISELFEADFYRANASNINKF